MKTKITRRSALKKVAGTAGAAVAASLSQSRAESETEFSVGDKKPYEAPSVVWREKFEIGQVAAVSCAKQPGNSGCNSGPFSA